MSNELDAVVDDWLFAQLIDERQRYDGSTVTVGDDDDEDLDAEEDDGLMEFEGALDALVALGALDGPRASSWRERFAATAEAGRQEAASTGDEAPQPSNGREPAGAPNDDGWDQVLVEPPDDALKARVSAYLEGLVAASRGDGGDASARLQMVLNVFREVGLLSGEEMTTWFDRLRPAPARPMAPPPFARFRGAELKHVLVGPAERRHGVRILSVELYADGVYVRWQSLQTREPEEDDEPETSDDFGSTFMHLTGVVSDPELRLSDDVGTRYLPQGGAHGSSPRGRVIAHDGTAEFTPAVPDTANTLTLAGEGFAFEVRVR